MKKPARYVRVNFSTDELTKYEETIANGALLPGFIEFVRQAFYEKLARVQRSVHNPSGRAQQRAPTLSPTQRTSSTRRRAPGDQ